MYFVKYGKEYLHDPRVEKYLLFDLSLETEENSCGYCDFTIYPDHPMYDKIKEHDANNPIEVYDDDVLIFSGFIYELGKEFYLDGHVRCKGELDYLNDSIVRPYATYPTSFCDEAPNNITDYFRWIIDQHNSQVEDSKKFIAGIVEGDKYEITEALEWESLDYPTTISELTKHFLSEDGLGGYIRIRHKDGKRYIDLLRDWEDTNSQILDFGVNLTDYTQTDDYAEIISAVVPIGASIGNTECDYNDGFFETDDVTVDPNKTYFTGSYTMTEYVDLDMFYNGVTYYEKVWSYVPTQDEEPVEGKIYYGRDGYPIYMHLTEFHPYFLTSDPTPVKGKTYYGPNGKPVWENLVKFDPDVKYYEHRIYYEHVSEYVPTTDEEPISGKAYYTRKNSYSECTDLTEFDPEVVYFEYNYEDDESYCPLTIDGLEDGPLDNSDFYKKGDYIYSKSSVEKYGIILMTYSDSEVYTKELLLEIGKLVLSDLMAPKRTIEIKAIDTHLINPEIKPIRIGEYVRIRSKPHNLDGYFLCRSIDLDLTNPESSVYTFGTTFDTLTGEQNKRINELNATICSQVEIVKKLTNEEKERAKPYIPNEFITMLNSQDDAICALYEMFIGGS